MRKLVGSTRLSNAPRGSNRIACHRAAARAGIFRISGAPVRDLFSFALHRLPDRIAGKVLAQHNL